jgi:hypothetical protein
LSSFHAEDLETGLKFTTMGRRLTIGGIMTIDLDKADSWVPRTVEPGLAQSAANACFGESLTAIQRLPLKGLGHTLKLISPPPSDRCYSTPSAVETVLLRRAEPVIRELIAACRKRDMERILGSGLDLVGLGPGLTPSGDDYMGGLLFTVHHLKAAFPGERRGEGNLIDDFLESARRLTNRISHTILSDLAHGHGPAPLHDTVSLLLQPSTTQQLVASVKQLIRIGHSSGWDMLAGACTGMLLKENIASRFEQGTA